MQKLIACSSHLNLPDTETCRLIYVLLGRHIWLLQIMQPSYNSIEYSAGNICFHMFIRADLYFLSGNAVPQSRLYSHCIWPAKSATSILVLAMKWGLSSSRQSLKFTNWCIYPILVFAYLSFVS